MYRAQMRIIGLQKQLEFQSNFFNPLQFAETPSFILIIVINDTIYVTYRSGSSRTTGYHRRTGMCAQ